MSVFDRRSVRNTETLQVFEQEFAREILYSERLRATMLAGVMAVFLVFGLVMLPVVHRLFERAFGVRFPAGATLSILAVMLIVELAVRFNIDHILKHEIMVPLMVRYGNAFFEISLVTAIIVATAPAIGFLEILISPVVLIYFLFITASILRLSAPLALFTGAVAAVEYLAVALLFVRRADSPLAFVSVPIVHIEKAAIILIVGAVAAVVTRRIKAQVLNSLEAVAERNRVMGVFGQHVSPAVVNKLLEQRADTPFSEARDVCVMFLDIRDFTTFSEGKVPEEVVDYLNSLFSFMIDIVNEHGGIVNKFLGDGFMAVFGAPLSTGDDVRSAVAASRDLLAAVEKHAAAGDIPPTQIGIGLHAGRAVTGQVGSEQRKEYTVIGDVVNVAARIETLNKQHGSRLLVSGDVLSALNVADEDAVEIGPTQVKGRSEPVSIYKLA